MFGTSQRVDPQVEFPALAAAIAGLPTPVAGGSAFAAGARVQALVVLKRRLEARLLAELACFDRQGLGEAYGFPTTVSWLRAVSNLDPPQASRVVSAARAAAVLPLLAGELAAGRVGVEHLDAVTRTTGKVPVEEVARHDATLRDLALVDPPSAVAVAGKTITECWRHDLAQADRERLREIRHLDVSATFDGLWHVQGLLPVEVGAALVTLLDPLAQRRGAEDDRTPTQRRADALAELLAGALRHAPLPDAAGERPRLTVIVQAGQPVAGQPVAGRPAAGPALVGEMAGRAGVTQAMIADGSLLAAFGSGSAGA